jgi:hypothetical protein
MKKAIYQNTNTWISWLRMFHWNFFFLNHLDLRLIKPVQYVCKRYLLLLEPFIFDYFLYYIGITFEPVVIMFLCFKNSAILTN